MPSKKITKIEPLAWYVGAERAAAADIASHVDGIEGMEEWSDIPANADWRVCEVPRAALDAVLFADRDAFIQYYERGELEDDERLFADTESDMQETGTEAHFSAEPAVLWIDAAGRMEILSDPYAVGAACHALGAPFVRALVAVEGANRFLPRSRAPRWSADPGWSVHALDNDGPRFESELALRGAMRKTAFNEMFGEIQGTRSPEQVEDMLEEAREWSGDARDAWLDQEPVFPMTRSSKTVEAMDDAAKKVIALLELCVEIGCGLVVGSNASAYQPKRADAA